MYLPYNESNLINSFLNVLNCMLVEYNETEYKKLIDKDIENVY